MKLYTQKVQQEHETFVVSGLVLLHNKKTDSSFMFLRYATKMVIRVPLKFRNPKLRVSSLVSEPKITK
jgi:hypothetical protein